MVKRSSSVGVNSIVVNLSVGEKTKFGARLPRSGDLEEWYKARQFRIMRDGLSNKGFDQRKTSTKDFLTIKSTNCAKPHRGSRDARGNAVGGSDLRELFVETDGLPDGALHYGNVAKADARPDCL